MVRSSGGRSFQRRGAVMDMALIFVCSLFSYSYSSHLYLCTVCIFIHQSAYLIVCLTAQVPICLFLCESVRLCPPLSLSVSLSSEM